MRYLLATLALLMLAGCSGGSTPVSEDPPVADTPVLAGVLPDLADLPEGSAPRDVSEVQSIPPTNCYRTANAEEDGDNMRLPSGETELCAAYWNINITYGGRAVPYLVPYSVKITTANDGDYWVAIPDYGTGSWNIHNTQYTGPINTIPVGLSANAGKPEGDFWFAIITYGGDTVTVTDIAMSYPDAGFSGEPVEYHEYLMMSDGTQLATFVYLPLEPVLPIVPDPPYPVVLMRTPYDYLNVVRPGGTGTAMWSTLQGLADANVMVILQYFRGRLSDSGAWPDSEGTEEMFRDHAGPEYMDAIETMDWIEARHFYNGDCLLSGPSALGLWIYQAATVLGDRVIGIYPQVSCGNVANWAALRNGCFKVSNVEGWLLGNSYPPSLLDEAYDNFENESYWDELDFDVAADGVDCPGYHESGWWDVDVEATIHSWQQINTNGGPLAAGNQKLIIGPWDHESVRTRQVGELTFPDTVTHDPSQVTSSFDGIMWASYMLGRDPFYSPSDHSVYYYLIGEEGNTSWPNNTWIVADDWPPAYTETTWYLQDDTFGLVDVEPANDSMTWTSHPATPVPSIGGANLPITTVIDAGPYNQALSLIHPDILTFSSGIMIDPLCLAGPIDVKFWVETDAQDTDIMVKLIDKYPGGDYMLVADSAVRLSWYLENYSAFPSVTPGQTYEVNLEVGQRAYNFASGHELILVVQSTNYPRYAVNPGNGDPFYDGSNGVAQTNILHLGTGNASQLTLPVYTPPI